MLSLIETTVFVVYVSCSLRPCHIRRERVHLHRNRCGTTWQLDLWIRLASESLVTLVVGVAKSVESPAVQARGGAELDSACTPHALFQVSGHVLPAMLNSYAPACGDGRRRLRRMDLDRGALPMWRKLTVYSCSSNVRDATFPDHRCR